MKTAILFLILVIPAAANCQDQEKKKKEAHPIGIGIKAGLNFSNVTSVSSINNSSQTGFHVGAFYSPSSKDKAILGSRTELIYSKQGYNFTSNTTTGSVNLQYILLPQLLTINITRYVQLQLGMQIAFLLNAKADSSKASIPGSSYSKIMDYYNKFDYSAAGGIEIHPFKGILIGARYNIGLANLYKTPEMDANGQPGFVPAVNVKNNVVQIFAGYKF
jgi:hypothetical protein